MPFPSRIAVPACAAGLALLLCGCTPEDEPAAAAVVTVTKVVDGDTFDVSDGRTVRVLGIDSCEAGTDAGRAATDAATAMLLSRPVTLVAQPGADLDPFGRALRYVTLPDGQDFGSVMVPALHTGVYENGDASVQAVTALQTLDAGGRICDDPAPDRRESGDGGGSGNASSGGSGPATKPRTGNSGHPCGPGERDGDGDGYCGEK